jgi:hypothetical protein
MMAAARAWYVHVPADLDGTAVRVFLMVSPSQQRWTELGLLVLEQHTPLVLGHRQALRPSHA